MMRLAAYEIPSRHITSQLPCDTEKSNHKQPRNFPDDRNLLYKTNFRKYRKDKLVMADEEYAGKGDRELMSIKSLLRPSGQPMERKMGGAEGTPAAAALVVTSPILSFHSGVSGDCRLSASRPAAVRASISISTQNIDSLRTNQRSPPSRRKKKDIWLLSGSGKSSMGNTCAVNSGGNVASDSRLPWHCSADGESMTRPRARLLHLGFFGPSSPLNNELGEECLGLGTYSAGKPNAVMSSTPAPSPPFSSTFSPHSRKCTVAGGDDSHLQSQSRPLSLLPICRRLSISSSFGNVGSDRDPKAVQHEGAMRCSGIDRYENVRVNRTVRAALRAPKNVDIVTILDPGPCPAKYKPLYSPSEFRKPIKRTIRERDYSAYDLEVSLEMKVQIGVGRRKGIEDEMWQGNGRMGRHINAFETFLCLTAEDQCVTCGDGGAVADEYPYDSLFMNTVAVSCTDTDVNSLLNVNGYEHERVHEHEYKHEHKKGFDSRAPRQQGQKMRRTDVYGELLKNRNKINYRNGDRSERNAYDRRNNNRIEVVLDLPNNDDDVSSSDGREEGEDRLREGEVRGVGRAAMMASTVTLLQLPRRRSMIKVDFYPDIDIGIGIDTDVHLDADGDIDFGGHPSIDIGACTNYLEQSRLEKDEGEEEEKAGEDVGEEGGTKGGRGEGRRDVEVEVKVYGGLVAEDEDEDDTLTLREDAMEGDEEGCNLQHLLCPAILATDERFDEERGSKRGRADGKRSESYPYGSKYENENERDGKRVLLVLTGEVSSDALVHRPELNIHDTVKEEKGVLSVATTDARPYSLIRPGSPFPFQVCCAPSSSTHPWSTSCSLFDHRHINPSVSIAEKGEEVCVRCRQKGPLWCLQCHSHFCGSCWEEAENHCREDYHASLDPSSSSYVFSSSPTSYSPTTVPVDSSLVSFSSPAAFLGPTPVLVPPTKLGCRQRTMTGLRNRANGNGYRNGRERGGEIDDFSFGPEEGVLAHSGGPILHRDLYPYSHTASGDGGDDFDSRRVHYKVRAMYDAKYEANGQGSGLFLGGDGSVLQGEKRSGKDEYESPEKEHGEGGSHKERLEDQKRTKRGNDSIERRGVRKGREKVAERRNLEMEMEQIYIVSPAASRHAEGGASNYIAFGLQASWKMDRGSALSTPTNDTARNIDMKMKTMDRRHYPALFTGKELNGQKTTHIDLGTYKGKEKKRDDEGWTDPQINSDPRPAISPQSPACDKGTLFLRHKAPQFSALAHASSQNSSPNSAHMNTHSSSSSFISCAGEDEEQKSPMRNYLSSTSIAISPVLASTAWISCYYHSRPQPYPHPHPLDVICTGMAVRRIQHNTSSDPANAASPLPNTLTDGDGHGEQGTSTFTEDRGSASGARTSDRPRPLALNSHPSSTKTCSNCHDPTRKLSNARSTLAPAFSATVPLAFRAGKSPTRFSPDIFPLPLPLVR